MMAEDRILPNLKTRITLDSAELAKGREEAAGLRSSLVAVGDGAKAGGSKLQSDLISPLRAATDAAQVFAAKKIFDFGKAGFEELKGANIVTAQTTNLLRNLGPAAGASIGDIQDLSNAMLRQSGVDDELAQKAANTALRLGVQGDEMKRVVQDANDLSQSFGDITSDSELLAKALAHPEQAARLLKPAIGGLTTEQQASIKSFVDAGDVASAHAEILGLVEQKVHGAAAAYGQTLPGQVAIAQQSLANLKGELVASLVPALSLATKGEQFLIDEFDKAPESAKAVIGGIALIGGGVLSLIRPVGDVVRLYSAWKDRSEEVAAATSALASVEGAEATASAAGAAASASSTAVTVASTAATNESAAAAARRIVSNEALVFTEQEVFAAQMQRLISNDALIAADDALIASEAEVSVAGAGMAGALGPLGLAAGVAAIGLTLFAGGNDKAAAASRDLDSADRQLDDTLVKLGKDTPGVALAMRDYLDGLSKQNAELPGVLGATGKLNEILAKTGVTTDYVAEKVTEGGDSFGRWVNAALAAHQITSEEAIELVSLGGRLDEQAKHTLESAAATGKWSAEQVTAAENAHKASDGAVNYAAALDSLQGQSNTTRGAIADLDVAVDGSTLSIDEQAKVVDAASKGLEGMSGLIDDLAAAMDRQYKSTFVNVDLVSSYEAAVDSLTETLKKNKYTLDLHEASGRADQKALEDTGLAIAALIENHFKQTHSIEGAIAVGEVYVANLGEQLKAAGYNQAQIAEMIDTMHLTPDAIRTEFSSNAAMQEIVVQKYIQLLKTDVPENITTKIETEINQGLYDLANTQLDNLAHGRTVDYEPYFKGVPHAGGVGVTRATGGPVGPNQPFIGAELGFEVLLNKGAYQAPADGGMVLPHAASVDFLNGLAERPQLYVPNSSSIPVGSQAGIAQPPMHAEIHAHFENFDANDATWLWMTMKDRVQNTIQETLHSITMGGV